MVTARPNLVTVVVHEGARPVEGATRDYDPLLELIGEAHFCLSGEASHGTREFYRERAEITKRLRLRTTGALSLWETGEPPETFPTGM